MFPPRPRMRRSSCSSRRLPSCGVARNKGRLIWVLKSLGHHGSRFNRKFGFQIMRSFGRLSYPTHYMSGTLRHGETLALVSQQWDVFSHSGRCNNRESREHQSNMRGIQRVATMTRLPTLALARTDTLRAQEHSATLVLGISAHNSDITHNCIGLPGIAVEDLST